MIGLERAGHCPALLVSVGALEAQVKIGDFSTEAHLH
jgi:hypothetical protein